MKALVKKRLLSVDVEGISNTGKLVKVYSLTLKGFLESFQYVRDKYRMRKFARNWSKIVPLVLGKWSHFKKFNVEDLALRRFSKVLSPKYLGPYSPYNLSKITGTFISTNYNRAFTEEGFTFHFYFPCIEDNDEERSRWSSICLKDPEIKKYYLILKNKFILHYKDHIHQLVLDSSYIKREIDDIFSYLQSCTQES